MNSAPYLPVLAVLVIWIERMREVATKRPTVAGKRQEILTFRLFMSCGIFMTAAGIVEYFWRGLPLRWVLLAAGLVISVASFVIRRRTIAALGKFWSLHIEMREGHEFVQSGPFRWMRHPVYFSMILELLATAVILGSWWTLAIVAAVFIPTLWRRLQMEERALVAQFGTAYEIYRQEVPMLLPLRFPIKR